MFLTHHGEGRSTFMNSIDTQHRYTDADHRDVMICVGPYAVWQCIYAVDMLQVGIVGE